MDKKVRKAKELLFAVTRSTMPIYERPYGECVLVVDNSDNKTIVVRGSRFGENEEGETVISRHNVRFYTHTDLTQAVRELNRLVAAAYAEQMTNVETLMEAFQKTHDIGE